MFRDVISAGLSSRSRRVGLVALTVLAGGAIAGLASCSPARLLNAFVPDRGYSVEPNIPYGPDERHRLDVYMPAGPSGGSPSVIVFFYGGSWKSGERAYYRFIGEAFARLGHVVVVPDYRLYPEVRFPAFMNDSARALSWVRENIDDYDGDADRIILVGHSAGAHIAALLALDGRYLDAAEVPSESVRGLVGIAGPYAIDPMSYNITRKVFAGIANANEARPVAYANANAPKMLLIHGEDDSTVKAINSQILANAVNEAGGDAEYAAYADLGHTGIILSLSSLFRGRDRVYEDVSGFLERI